MNLFRLELGQQSANPFGIGSRDVASNPANFLTSDEIPDCERAAQQRDYGGVRWRAEIDIVTMYVANEFGVFVVAEISFSSS